MDADLEPRIEAYIRDVLKERDLWDNPEESWDRHASDIRKSMTAVR